LKLARTTQKQLEALMAEGKPLSTDFFRSTVVNSRAPKEYFDEIEALFQPREMRRFNTRFVHFALNML
jgi:hypothetical protein